MTPRSAADRDHQVNRALTTLAGVYFALVTIWSFGPTVYSSAERVADGQVWLLLTSALDVNGSHRTLQLAATAFVSAFAILREGPRWWWLAALVGHAMSALLAYGVLELAVLLDSDSAEQAADDPDYGISCVLAATTGALLVSGLGGWQQRRDAGHPHPAGSLGIAKSRVGDEAALILGTIGLLGSLAVAYGWYDMEHPIAFALGAAVIWLAHRRDAPQKPQHRASPSV